MESFFTIFRSGFSKAHLKDPNEHCTFCKYISIHVHFKSFTTPMILDFRIDFGPCSKLRSFNSQKGLMEIKTFLLNLPGLAQFICGEMKVGREV